MSKFYIQSGVINLVVDGESAELAAISALDSVMSPHVWIYDDPSMSEEIRRDHLMIEALYNLDAVIRVSEKGFNRDDAWVMGTPEVVEEWHLLMTRLSGLYVAAGLPSRPLPVSDCTALASPSLAS